MPSPSNQAKENINQAENLKSTKHKESFPSDEVIFPRALF